MTSDPYDPRYDGTERPDDSGIPANQRALLMVIAEVVGVLEEASEQGLRLDVEQDRQTIAAKAVGGTMQMARTLGLTFR
ncbi:hypothetical protein [Streptomyces coeruleorubidus]|uniref:hypothetical protein n=1 Tax=Streptomyces coeruleorubidus TaxID=116188 RepID=UPI0033AB106C